jgi:hypothetical protein
MVKIKHRSSLNAIKKEDQTGQEASQPKTVDDSEVGKHSTKASRHLFLIRHGQYEINAKEADLMVLTSLGN